MKKIIFFLICFVILVGLISCVNSQDYTPKDKSDEVTDDSSQDYTQKDKIDGVIEDISQDNIVSKLMTFGFTENEANEMREIFLKCGLNNIDNAEPTDNNASIDDLVAYRVVIDDKRIAWFTVEKRKLFYVGLNGVDVYDMDKGGYLINISDIHIPESSISFSTKELLRNLTEAELDNYFINALYYDGWGVARSDDDYMVQCEVYASNKLGVKDWIKAKVWYVYNGETYAVTGIMINGERYK